MTGTGAAAAGHAPDQHASDPHTRDPHDLDLPVTRLMALDGTLPPDAPEWIDA